MTDVTVIEIAQKSMVLAITICAPVLGFGLAVGLAVSIFQAATQIHEMTLTFIPKILAVAVAIAIFGQWMLTQTVSFTTELLQNIPSLVK
jgi:flagellar biosynthetic protein FliQ